MTEQELKKWLKENNQKNDEVVSTAYSFVCFMKHVYSYKDYSSDELLLAHKFLKENKDEVLRMFEIKFADNDKFMDFCRNTLLNLERMKSNEEIKEEAKK